MVKPLRMDDDRAREALAQIWIEAGAAHLRARHQRREADVVDAGREVAAAVEVEASVDADLPAGRAEGEALPDWHYLVCGDRDAVHRAGESIVGWTVGEDVAGPLENHLVERAV